MPVIKFIARDFSIAMERLGNFENACLQNQGVLRAPEARDKACLLMDVAQLWRPSSGGVDEWMHKIRVDS